MLRNLEASSGVYALINVSTGRVYIGQSSFISYRLDQHVQELARGRHRTPLLQSEFNQFGITVFAFRIVEPISHRLDRIRLESSWIQALTASDIPLYNAILSNRTPYKRTFPLDFYTNLKPLA